MTIRNLALASGIPLHCRGPGEWRRRLPLRTYIAPRLDKIWGKGRQCVYTRAMYRIDRLPIPLRWVAYALTWAVLIVAVLIGVSLLPATIAGIAYLAGLPVGISAVLVTIASLVSLYFFAGLLDY